MTKILAVNAGSSTLKWKLFEMPAESVIANGMIDRLNLPKSVFTVETADGQKYTETQDNITNDLGAAMLITRLKTYGIVEHISEIMGVGHRIVAGGEIFQDSTIITPKVLKQINDLKEFAPLHNPVQAYYISVFQKLLPKAIEVAVFDSSLYTAMPKSNALYSIPYEYYEKYGARKYGAHGTSHRYVSQRAAEILKVPFDQQKMITLHLGSGCSITAFDHGKVIDTSMGFTPVAGVTMSTRSGDIDPSLVVYLIQKMKIKNAQKMIDLLNQKSGLLGISGISPDLRDIEAAEKTNQRAKLALEIYVNRIVRYVGSYVAEIGGLDTLVFTAGTGENGIEIRQRVADQLAYFGVHVVPELNNIRAKERIISPAEAPVKVLVVPTNEELMIARDVQRLAK